MISLYYIIKHLFCKRVFFHFSSVKSLRVFNERRRLYILSTYINVTADRLNKRSASRERITRSRSLSSVVRLSDYGFSRIRRALVSRRRNNAPKFARHTGQIETGVRAIERRTTPRRTRHEHTTLSRTLKHGLRIRICPLN